jgi:alcohol dehydrogenase, propanol-preferring
MVLNSLRGALKPTDLPDRLPGPEQVRVSITACGVCRTDLHVVDGELPDPVLPIIPGHEIVGHVDAIGARVKGLEIGQRVGIPWLGHTCGTCAFCISQHENLCDHPVFTGYTRDGGFATATVADAHFVLPLANGSDDAHTAPLLCAGLIGWRSLRMAGDVKTLGIFGFGAAAHIVAQIAKYQGISVFAFTRADDVEAQKFATSLGAVWAGASDDKPPECLDAAIIYAPVGDLVPRALQAVRKGGRVICAGIHMSDIPSFRYELLWGERSLASVANLTRQDGVDFLAAIPSMNIVTQIRRYPLDKANQALSDLRAGRFLGAAVLEP